MQLNSLQKKLLHDGYTICCRLGDARAELFLRSVDKFGAAWSVSPVVMGLTVVAFATGAPELAISLQAAVEGKADLVLGNILGSNIANILLIMGIAALVKPVQISQRIIKIDIPIVIGASVLLYVLAIDGTLSSLDGLIIVAALILYSLFTYSQIRKDRVENQQKEQRDVGEPVTVLFYGKYIFLLLCGLLLIVLGSRFMVDAAVTMAEILGISELIIGLTIVSIGTSLPEVATSVSAVRHNDSDTAVANVMGSNLYNILLTLGFTILIAPGVLHVSADAIRFDLPFMVAIVMAILPLFWAGRKLGKAEAVGFLCYYAGYMSYLVLHAMNSPYKETMEWAALWIFFPLTALYILLKVIRTLLSKKRK